MSWRTGVNDRLEDIQSRLEGISEEIGDLSMDLLREAVEAGETQRPPLDKVLGRVRRSVDKAAALLLREL
jgi:hypothetical protein